MTNANDIVFDNEIVQSLCYLHQECCLNEESELSEVLELAIDGVLAVGNVDRSLSVTTADALNAHVFLQGFRKLGIEDKKRVLAIIEDTGAIALDQ